MRSEIRRHSLALGLIGAAAALLASSAFALPESQAGAAAAQPTAGALTVVAPRVLRRNAAAPAYALGAPIEVVSLQKTVKFGDLDLTTQAGVDAFKSRIMSAARDACNELETEYPSTQYLLVPPDQNCPDTTATSALAVAKEIIAAARVQPK